MSDIVKFLFPKKWKHLKPGAYTATMVRVKVNRRGSLELVLKDVQEVKLDGD